MSQRDLPSLPLVIAACLLLVNQVPAGGNAPTVQPSPPKPVSASVAAPVSDSAAPHCIPAWIIDAAGIRRLPDYCPSTTAAPAGNVPVTSSSAVMIASEICEPPWFVDPQGIRRLLLECLGGADTPAPRATESRVAPTEVMTPLDCDPPWFVDAAGIHRIRPECLNSAPARIGTASFEVLPTARPTPQGQSSAPTDCQNPTYVDAQGIRRLKVKCL